jgi:hypothetical protein
VHLPGLNTPQFEWVRTTLRRQPMPVPPFYEPEVAADAVLWAADHPRREFFVGAPTAPMVLANKLAPGLVDRYLAKTSVSDQQTDTEISPGRPDYLYAPLPGDRGARGPFCDEAKPRSLSWTLTKAVTRLLSSRSPAHRALSSRARRARRSPPLRQP